MTSAQTQTLHPISWISEIHYKRSSSLWCVIIPLPYKISFSYSLFMILDNSWSLLFLQKHHMIQWFMLDAVQTWVIFQMQNTALLLTVWLCQPWTSINHHLCVSTYYYRPAFVWAEAHNNAASWSAFSMEYLERGYFLPQCSPVIKHYQTLGGTLYA